MKYIIETDEEFDNYKIQLSNKTIICVPIMSDINLHYVHDYLSLLYIRIIEDSSANILCFNHSESLNKLNYDKLHELFKIVKIAYVYDLKCILQYCSYNHVYDLELAYYFTTNESFLENEYNTPVHEHFINKFYKLKNINYIIPLTKHFEKCSTITDIILSKIKTFEVTESFKWYNIIYRQLTKIENAGLYVDVEELNKYYPNIKPIDNKLYSSYNMYTTTGRPSNAYNGINFGALNSSSGIRSAFKSRFDIYGRLIQIDYDAYHIRLLAKLCNYSLDYNINVHEYLGQYYFNKRILNVDEYNRSKKITFQLIYGRIRNEYLHIPLMKKIYDYTYTLWGKMKIYGYVYTPIFKRKLYKEFFYDLNPEKLLNYILQATEIEQSMLILNSYISSKLVTHSRIILYTYDSYLFDYHVDDLNNFNQILDIFEFNKQFPCKISIGDNYNDMKISHLR